MDAIVSLALELARVAAQTLTIYLLLIVGLTFAGRRLISQLTLLELAIVMILGSAVETSMVAGDTSLPAGLVSATTLMLGNRALSFLLGRSPWLRHLLVGRPILLVRDGQLLPGHLSRAGLTEADVLGAIRERGYADLKRVRFAVLESDGSVGVIPVGTTVLHDDRSIRASSSGSEVS